MNSELNPDYVYPELRERVNENTDYVPKEIVKEIRKNSHEEGFVVYRSRTESIFRQVDYVKTPKPKRKSFRRTLSRKKSSNLDANSNSPNTRSSATSKRFTPQDISKLPEISLDTAR